MADFHPPIGMRMEDFMWSPAPVGRPDEDERPLPNISAFDKLIDEDEPARLRWLSDWVEDHRTCAYIMRHHGPNGLKRVMRGIARACSKHQVHMGTRVAGFAEALSLEVY